MKIKISEKEMASFSGGLELTNGQCMLLGGLAFGSLLIQQWAVAIGITATAITGKCFE